MKRKIYMGIIVVLIACFCIAAKKADGDVSAQKGIADKILRFHVLANSDSEKDQELKLIVRDRILNYLHPFMEGEQNLEETKEIVTGKLDDIVRVAEGTIKEEGYDYQVSVGITNCYFPTKTYGDCTFPEGNYEALRVEIGKGKGQNWWCVLYPNLCFIDATKAIVEEPEKRVLENLLTEDEYGTIIKDSEYKISFKYLKFLNILFE